MSEETKQSKKLTGSYLNCKLCGSDFYATPSRIKLRKYCSRKCAHKTFIKEGAPIFKYWQGKKRANLQETNATKTQFKKGLIPWNKGIKWERMTGKNNPMWVGGHIKHPDKRIRSSIEYVEWRTNVFIRDNYTCQFCGVRGGQLQADHIKSFALYPSLRFDLNNGRTLCVECHKTTPTYARNARFARELMPL